MHAHNTKQIIRHFITLSDSSPPFTLNSISVHFISDLKSFSF